ncbi:nitrate- and nitrite sensing domain-containing protein [Streptomyces sp. NPDC097619]|uniref:sensor histidine kinase n=1 Tax=Streptomyces sp. NPDC097619 TaxID=3157228 RepID=UPI00331BD0AB
MQNKRSRRNGSDAAKAERSGGTAGNGNGAEGRADGRSVRVRTRLVLGVAAVGLTVLGAGAPALVDASAELNESQRLVTLSEHTRQTLALVHALSDERDAVVEFVADGRESAGKAAVQERTARVDQRLAEAAAGADEEAGRALARVPAVRQAAISGKENALAAHQDYSELIGGLLAPSDELAERTPPRAEEALAAARALAPLAQAVDQSSATRGLLLAALSVPEGAEPERVYDPTTGRYEDPEPSAEDKTRDELSAAAQRARVREQAALDAFARAASPEVRQVLAATVTGPEVKAAEGFLGRLTDQPSLSTEDRDLDAKAVDAALTARTDRMRTVESTLAAERATALATLRDEDVTSLEVLAGLVGLLFLIAVGVSTGVARTLTRPLSVLKRGAERLASPEGSSDPVRFIGRNDEFAAVVRSLNAMHARHEAQSTALHTRIAGLDGDRRRLIDRNDTLSAAKTALDRELAELRAHLDDYRRVLSTASLSLSLRTLGLVERQLAVIEQMEAKEQDPDRLATLFKVDHLATVMRRHNENLLVLAGQEHTHGHPGPVPLVDVMRAAVSEIERYERVDLRNLPPFAQVAGHAADDVSHVVAELLENATTFSPPDVKVRVSAWLLDEGDVVVSVQDQGIGVTEDRLAALNSRLSDPEAYEHEDPSEHGPGLGLYVAGRLAGRHGVTAELQARRDGGLEALVVIPVGLLPTAPVTPEHRAAAPGAPALHLPGAVAEANSNHLPPRHRPDPVIALAEEAFEAAADEAAATAAGTAPAEATAPAEQAPAETHPVVPAQQVPAPAHPVEEAPRPVAEPAPEPDPTAAAEPVEQAEPVGHARPEPAEQLPPADQVFRAVPSEAPDTPAHGFAADGPAAPHPAPEPAEPAVTRRQVFDVEPPAGEEYRLPPEAQVFRVPAPEPEPSPATDPAPEEPVAHAQAPEPGDAPAPERTPAEEAPADPDAWLLAAPLPRQADGGPRHADHDHPGGAPRNPADPATAAPQPGATPEQALPGGPAPQPPTAPRPHAASPAEGPDRTAPEPPAAEGPYRLTDKGLPKRTPRVVEPAPTTERKTAPRVDAEELRRRLGGFYQGARDGRRVVDAELAERAKDEGDTVEEART